MMQDLLFYRKQLIRTREEVQLLNCLNILQVTASGTGKTSSELLHANLVIHLQEIWFKLAQKQEKDAWNFRELKAYLYQQLNLLSLHKDCNTKTIKFAL